MAFVPSLFKTFSRVEDLPDYKDKKVLGYNPFNFELEPPKENHFTSDQVTLAVEPAIFSTRGTLYPKRSCPEETNINNTNIPAPLGEHPYAVKVIASRIRIDFPLDCKGVTDFSVSFAFSFLRLD